MSSPTMTTSLFISNHSIFINLCLSLINIKAERMTDILNPIKTILPTVLITTCAVLVYLFFSQLPQPVQQALPLLPYLLAAAVVLVAVYFNLSGLFYCSLVVT